MVNDDAQLIDEALAGRSVAFGRLVTKYQDRLYNAVVHVVGSTEEARDVVARRLRAGFFEAGFVSSLRRRFTHGSIESHLTLPSAGFERHGRPFRSNGLAS